MLGREHLLFGTSTAIATALTFYNTGTIDIVGSAILVGGAMLGSIAPDIDTESSSIGRKLKPISYVINKLLGHRTYMHDPVLWIPLAIILTIKFPFLFGFFFGYLGHLFLDSFTSGGIPMFYLINKKRFHMLPYAFKFKADSLTAQLVTWGMSLMIIIFIGTINKYFL